MGSKLRIGVAGYRGTAYMSGLRSLPEADVTAFCEKDPQRLESVSKQFEIAQTYSRFTDMLENVDAVVVATPMQLHVPHCLLALQARKHVFSEVTAAVSLDECWRLLDAVKSSGLTYMMSENCCYFHNNLIVLEMARRGMFGEPYFGEGEYIHEVRHLHHAPDGSPTWRYYWHAGIRGCTYPTHSLGPVMQWFKAVQPEERIASVVCLGSGANTDAEHPHDDTCLMLCSLASGKLIKIRLDTMSNRPHLGNWYALQGTQGAYETSRDGRESGLVWVGENRLRDKREWRPLTDFEELLPANYRADSEEALKAGHGGSDYHVARAFVETVVKGTPSPVDIYDALEWTAAGLCSQISITNGGVPVIVPDFHDTKQRPVLLDAPLHDI